MELIRRAKNLSNSLGFDSERLKNEANSLDPEGETLLSLAIAARESAQRFIEWYEMDQTADHTTKACLQEAIEKRRAAQSKPSE